MRASTTDGASADGDGAGSVDPLLQRLQDKYTKQRSEQLAGRRKRLERDLNAQAVKNSTLPPSVELLSDEAVHAFHDLEVALTAQPGSRRTMDQLRHIRELVNQELRQALSFLEEGYSSAFQTLLSEAQLMRSGEEDSAHRSSSGGEGGTAPGKVSAKATPPMEVNAAPLVATSAAAEHRSALMEQCPPEWRAVMKHAVVDEIGYQSAHTVRPLPRKLTVQEALSAVTSLFAESLASMLFCEVVRIYLYDDNGSLHCCACFPSSAGATGDPMRATYTELMLAKELHHSVCSRGIAINGSEAQLSMLSRRDVDLIKEEVEASGWGSMRSCLIFPVLFHEGIGRASGSSKGRKSAGMIHAVNKMNSVSGQPGRFTADDEVLMSMNARTLGCMLTRYPVHFFTLRVDEALWAATHPNEGPPPVDGHLPHLSSDVVEDATHVGMQAMLSPQPIMILRAPISDVYQSRTHRARNRKLGDLVTNDTALSSVEFNLTAVNELWETGMEDNVLMHKQYRTLNEQMNNTKLLMRNLLDGLAVTRTMRQPDEMARYVQSLEMFARSENTEMLSEFIANTLLAQSESNSSKNAGKGSRLQDHIATAIAPTSVTSPATARRTIISDFGSVLQQSVASTALADAPQSTAAAPSVSFPAHREIDSAVGAVGDDDPFLSAAEATTLFKEHMRLNTTVASRLHVDGPEGIRSYSSHPASKRAQMRFIEGMQQRRVAEERQRLQMADGLLQGPRYRQGTAAQPTSSQRRPVQKTPAPTAAALSSTDYAAKRPYRV